ncbi:MAG TPA: recombination-associated protein RdgC [Anaeromyxobacteraceae bacterium]|nr:recombination-associated protein RdgC [Anaeromyxobacteraceae bacterium]
MALLGGSITVSRLRARKAPADPKRSIQKGLRSAAFEPLVPGAEEDRAIGFVELEDHDAVEFPVSSVFHGEHVLFGFRIDTIRVRGADVKAELERWTAAFADEHGRPPARREKAAHRDAIRQRLRAATPPTTRVHDVSWNLATGEVLVWTASRKVVEEIVAAIETAFRASLAPASAAGLAAAAGIDPESLSPTAALVGAGTGREEAR